MEAIRQFVKVKNHQINITLPEDFNEMEVEVIILSAKKAHAISKEAMDEVNELTSVYFKNSSNEADDFTLSDHDKNLLDFRANQPREDFISAEESIERLKKKYGI
jgi:hypothetical protein